MPIVAQIACAAERVPDSSRQGGSADCRSDACAPGGADAPAFAKGLRSLLGAIGEPSSDSSPQALPESNFNPSGLAANQTQRDDQGVTAARTSGDASIQETSVAPVQSKPSPQAQATSLGRTLKGLTKGPKRDARNAGSETSTIHLKSPGSQATSPFETAMASPAFVTYLTKTTPGEGIAAPAPESPLRNQTTHGADDSLKSAPGIAAVPESMVQEPVIAADLRGSENSRDAQQGDGREGELQPEATFDYAQAPHSPSYSQTEAATSPVATTGALSAAVPGNGKRDPVDAPPDSLVGPPSGVSRSTLSNHTRRTDPASTFHPTRAAAHLGGSSPANYDSLIQAPSQRTDSISDSTPGRDVFSLDRHTTASSPAPSSSSMASGELDAFATLDRASSGPQTTWIHAGAHHAEAGYLDPSLGWVTVRADGVLGGVHASVVPGSAEAASALSGHLAGLNAFMADHQGHSATVTLAPPSSDGSHPGPSQQDGAMSGQQNQPHQHGRNPSAPFAANSNQSSVSLSIESPTNTSVQSTTAQNGRGVHLSVMA